MRRKKNPFLDLLEYYFGTYLPVAKGLSPSTISSYKSCFRLLLEYMIKEKRTPPDRISFDVLDSGLIMEFLDWLEKDRKCSISTRNQRLSALAAFAEYAQNRDFEVASVFRNNVSKIPIKKAAKPCRSYFTRDEVKILFELPDIRTEIGIRDRTLLCLMYASGMRAQEVCDLKIGDIQFYTDRAGITVHGKGQKVRRIGISSSSSVMLKKYVDHRNLSDRKERHIFSSQTHEKMTVSCIEEIYSKYINAASKEHPDMFREHYTPHSMRHTTATHMLEAGVPLIVVKNFLGHSSLQTTQIYAEVTQETMNRQLKAWNDRWFLKSEKKEVRNDSSNVPDFLK